MTPEGIAVILGMLLAAVVIIRLLVVHSRALGKIEAQEHEIRTLTEHYKAARAKLYRDNSEITG